MKDKNSQNFRKILLSFLFFFFAAFFGNNSYAIYDGIRNDIGFDGNLDLTLQDANIKIISRNRCDVGKLDFNPFVDNKDIDWDLSNPTCIAFLGTVGLVEATASKAASIICTTPKSNTGRMMMMGEKYTNSLAQIGITPMTAFTALQLARYCTTLNGVTAALSVQCAEGVVAMCTDAALATTDASSCCSAAGAHAIAVATAVSTLSIIWDVAKNTYGNARICGHLSYKWENQTDEETKKRTWIKTKGPHRLCLENLFLGKNHSMVNQYCINNDSRSIANKSYRELIYGGMEFEDNGSGACKNPTTWNSAKKYKILGYDSDNQRYYMNGPNSTPVFACSRFLARSADKSDQSSIQQAYDCCKKRSQNSICIENRTGLGDILGDYEHRFCELGSKCIINNVTFETYQSKAQSNYICAKTYSVCPYNHTLAGGTEQKKMNGDKIENFCQFMNHCSKIPILPYVHTSNLDGGFISSACRDLKGDSQNNYGYNSELINTNRGFSAPIAQCFKETMENVFLNKAGYTKCINADEQTDNGDSCVSGYVFKKGGDLPTKSFFIKIQDNLQVALKMALIVSIMGFGFGILIAVPGAYIERKKLLPYIIKIGLVMYFAVGDGWQFGFMQGVIGASSYMSNLTFRPDESGAETKLDGCQFPRYNYADSNESTKYIKPSYPSTKEYLRIWDTLDCKISTALGFGPEVSVPNLILMILAGFFTGGLGIIFVVATFSFAFFLISLTIRALHLFLISSIAVVILLYVSPITITLSLFARTKGIFDNWWKQLFGFTFQPMILFAYIGIMITVFDSVIIGSDVTFDPSGKVVRNLKQQDNPQVNKVSIIGDKATTTVSAYYDDIYGQAFPKKINCSGQADETSIYCIFRIASMKNFSGFEPLGLGIPILTSLNQAKLNTIIKAAMIMFIFTGFMDQIATVAKALVGGADLKPDWHSSTAKMAASLKNGLRAVQKRGNRGLLKGVKNIGGATRDLVRSKLDRGKSVKEHDDIKSNKSIDSVTVEKTKPPIDQVKKANNEQSAVDHVKKD
jgi:hypothetical protein